MNDRFRVGFGDDRKLVDYQLGMKFRTTHYQLRQWDHVSGLLRKQGQHWFEWSPSVGLSGTVGGARIRYAGVLTVRFEDLPPWPRSELLDLTNANGYDIVAAPGRPVGVLDAYGFSQQVCLSFPIRN